MHQDEYTLLNGRRFLKRGGHNRGRDLDAFAVMSNGKIGVVVILKSASRSILGSEAILLTSDDKDKLPDELHVFVRDPIERLRSSYQFFKKQPPIVGRTSRDDLTWKEFVDYVLSGVDNPHWRPASKTVGNTGKAAIPHLFENINEEYPLGKLDVKNVSVPIEGIDLAYRIEELKLMYSDDYKLREQAEG